MVLGTEIFIARAKEGEARVHVLLTRLSIRAVTRKILPIPRSPLMFSLPDLVPTQHNVLFFVSPTFVLSYLLTPPLLTQPGFANLLLPDQFLLEYGLEVMGNHGQFCRAHQSEPSRGWLSAMMLK